MFASHVLNAGFVNLCQLLGDRKRALANGNSSNGADIEKPPN